MPKYQGESEDSTASKKARLKIKMKGLLPFVKAPVNLIGGIGQFGVQPANLRAGAKGRAPVRRGLKNPLLLLKKREAEEKEKERKRNEEYKKRAKRSDRMS
tara:strand:- start:23 stop:325 length:303 start_codon:yes stop_codon:yes gene_type:complete